ncbi:UDP-sugar-dependent glycosyltransferase 52 [Neofusicoccum parvum]|uniref:UDP-sugar-dependent glycosyltransferase 52 n=1 Tax=Neofusicoccum parvum TaxID=310453 RepID=A0ACB5SLL2_9PEZI|nr:UDP-sugar-dependent glycosyltransferase 52 [Neofusicoccum parvum]
MAPPLQPGQPFFYDFDEYSPSESDTSTSSSDDRRQQDDPAPTRKKLKRRPTDRSLEEAPGLEGGGDDDPVTKRYSRFSVGNQYFKTKGKVSRLDGRLKISVDETANTGWLAKALGSGIKHHLGLKRDEDRARSPEAGRDQQQAADALDAIRRENLGQAGVVKVPERIPKLNVVIIVIGSRGDIQPFLKVGKILQNDHGHRVRIATHPAFKDFVEKDSGLEFFSVGGDPSELMAFMVKNPGLIPSVETVKAGEIGRRRKSMYDMFNGMWRACINATDDESDKANIKMMGEKDPFIADAIIANPPSFAHVHIAERLGIPLHMMFTFPYTPTSQFPHPLANIKRSNIDDSYTNFMSYPLVEMMTWQGLGDLVNKFRVKTLSLEPVSTLWAPGQLYRLQVPYTYMWSPTLVPKPEDWGPEVNVTGFTFLDLASSFTPPDDLTKFLEAGPPPVYIGFGSIVVDDPDAFTELIFRAVELAGVRALVSKGWGGIGGEDSAPDNVYLLENTPHDWLFPRVSAVVHHGGAGTTAIGLKCGKPTMIVPFFGDQPFWGAMVSKAKAGAHACVPYKKLTAERLAEGIAQCLSDEARANVTEMAERIEAEGDGAANAVASFHASLPLSGEESMRCAILDDRVATWQLKEKGKWKGSGGVKLSPLAAEILTVQKRVRWSDLRLARTYDWNDFDGPGEPISGVGGAVTGTVVEATQGIGSVPANIMKSVKKHGRHEHKKRKLAKKKQKALDNAAREQPSPPPPAPDLDVEPQEPRESEAVETDDKAATMAGQEGQQQQLQEEEGEEEEEEPQPSDSSQRPNAPTRASTTLSTLTDPGDPLPTEVCRTTGRGLHQSASALARAPVDLALALAQGFHNAPRLYGDDTVRRPVRVTGWRSGLRASRRELAYGVYDGWTGLWKQPARGWREGGLAGAVRGAGLGAGGLVLKNVSAVVGPVGFCAKGLHREVRRRRGERPLGPVRRARILQGRGEGAGVEGFAECEGRVLQAWDAKEKEADERKSGGKKKKKKKKTTKDEGATAGDDEVINNEKLQLAAGQRPVPRRRSTLKKKQRPPKAAGAKKRQHQAPVGEDEEGQQPPAIPRRSASAKTPRTEAEMGKRAGTVFDVDDHPDNGDEQQDRFEGFVFHDGAAATKLPDEVAGKDSMAEELAVAERKPSPGDPALVRSASDTVDFAFGGRNGSGNGNGNGVTAA